MRTINRAASITIPGLAILGLQGLIAGCDDKVGDTGNGANLTISSSFCTQEGSRAVCDVVIENNGDGPSGSFRVGVYDENPNRGARPESSTRHDGLASGQVEGVTLSLDCSGSSSRAVVDIDDEVAESFEDDNSFRTSPARR